MAGQQEQARKQQQADRERENESPGRSQQGQPVHGISTDQPAEGRRDVNENNQQENVQSDRNTNSQPDRNNR